MVNELRACSSTETGFIVNSVHVKGAVFAYGQIWMMWKVAKLQDVTPESLALLQLIKPVPDLLVFGSGSTQQRPPKEALLALRELNIGLEALPTVRFEEICNSCQFAGHTFLQIRRSHVHRMLRACMLDSTLLRCDVASCA